MALGYEALTLCIACIANHTQNHMQSNEHDKKNDKFYLSALCRSLLNLDFVHMGKLFLQLPLIACVVLVERWHFPRQVPPLCMPGSPTAVQVAEGG